MQQVSCKSGLDLVMKFCMESQLWSITQMIAPSGVMKRVPVIQRECIKWVLVFVHTLSSKYHLTVSS